jgi:hypothetical protein
MNLIHEFAGYGFAFVAVAVGVAAWTQVPVFGRYVGIFMFIIAAAICGRESGYQSALTGIEAQRKQEIIASRDARIAELERQASDARVVANLARSREAETAVRANELQIRISDYEAELSKAGAVPACVDSPSDIDRLRGIVGNAKRGRDQAKPTSATK